MARDLLEYQLCSENLESAVKAGLAHFSCCRTDLDVEILRPVRPGFLGLFGRKPALFRLKIIDRRVAGCLVLGRLLDLSGFSGEYELQLIVQRNCIVIRSALSSLIIGRQGQSLDSFETLLNGMLDRALPGSGRLSLDCDGYRERQKEAIKQLTLRLVGKVRKTGRSASTDPLPPEQRQIMHHLVKSMDGLTTVSHGPGPLKKMVISTQRG